MTMLHWIRNRFRSARARRLSLQAGNAADARRIDEGMQLAQAAMEADSALAAPHFVMGRLRELAGRLAEAEASYRRAVALEPAHAKACNNLGAVLIYQGRIEEALACYRQALSLDPDQPEANQNLAILTQSPLAWEAAIRGFLRRTAADPADARAHASLGDIYRGLGRLAEARASLDRAIVLEPGNAEAHYGKAMLLLTSGEYAEGWKEYEWRWRMDNQYSFPARRFAGPIWDGSAVEGAVFMHGETALGESLQFVRYARLVAQRCRSVIFECAPRLKPLLEGVEGVARVTSPGEPQQPFSAHVPLFSLPRLFGTTLDSIPWQGPYIHADPQRVAQWRHLFQADGKARLKIGLVWSGSPQNPHNRERSIAPGMLAPLARVAGTAWYSLQSGTAEPMPPQGMDLVDLAARERDFLDTAAFIAHLDLVIAIDTSVAHLAGAMGARTWVLLNRTPDWRFHLERPDNPWYPTMRLYRQTQEGDWAGVVGRVATELGELASRA